VTLAALFLSSVPPAQAWPASPHRRSACGSRPAPAICKLHYWVDHTWRSEARRGLPRTRYWYSAERHPNQAPWLARRIAWRGRARRVARIPVAPWPPGWLSDALCVHHYEGAWNADTGNGYFGGMQFDLGTWQANGGHGRPDLASPQTQLAVAYTTWRARGWEPWPVSSAECGLR
jgi:hypothetical protein